MKRGSILEAARRDGRELLQGNLVLVLLSAGVLGYKRKSGTDQHLLRFWVRGKGLSDTLDVGEAESRAAIEGATARLPGLVVADAAGFERRWKEDRAQCEREVDLRLGRTSP